MSTLKTKVESDEVIQFLKERFDADIPSLEPITGGELSQAFFFSSCDREYVVRINKEIEGFKKDQYAYEHFASEDVPVPETIELGAFNTELYYSITERMPGRTLEQCNKAELLGIIDSTLVTLDAIHSTSIKGSGYGDWDTTGNGKYTSWQEHLLQLLEDNERDLKTANHADFLEKDVINKLTEKYCSLIDYCPEIRKLVHADFESSNTLSDGEKVTGVIDWENSKYGDPLFDVAWADFWNEEVDYKGIYFKHLRDKEEDTTNYEERLLCYKLYFGIGSLFFFAKSDQEKSYYWTRDRLLSICGL